MKKNVVSAHLKGGSQRWLETTNIPFAGLYSNPALRSLWPDFQSFKQLAGACENFVPR